MILDDTQQKHQQIPPAHSIIFHPPDLSESTPTYKSSGAAW